jgi:hypothetical protein
MQHDTQRHHLGRRLWYPSLSRHTGGQQTAHAGVRQAHGLLPACHAHARGHPRCVADQHPARHPSLQRAVGRRQPVGHEHPIRGAAQPRWAGPSLHHWQRFCGQPPQRLGFRRQHFLWPRFGQAVGQRQCPRCRGQCVCLPCARPRTLWRGRIRRRLQSAEH